MNFALEWLLDYDKRPKWKKNPLDESREKAIYGEFELFIWAEKTAEPVEYKWIALDGEELIQSGNADNSEKSKKEAEAYIIKITSGDY